MKSFDEMADDFVDEFAKRLLPKIVSEGDRKVLWIGYMAGIAAGVAKCVDMALDEKESRGL